MNTNIVKPEREVLPFENIKRPAVSVNVLIFSLNKDKLQVILTERTAEPFKGQWNIPGALIYIDESLEEAVKRVLTERIGLKEVYLEQLYTFGDTNRDPRGRVISITYFALVPFKDIDFSNLLQDVNVKMADVKHLPEQLAFDHETIIKYGFERVKSKLEYSTIARGLLPKKFTLSNLQKVYEVILGEKIDKRNFRKRISTLDLLKPTGEKFREGNHRPAALYEFKSNELVFFD
jgi:8-oxo-dGTP diphosphatase